MEMNDILGMFRRRIGDTTEPFTYEDSVLINYIKDAILDVELDWTRGFAVENDIFNIEPSPIDAKLFTIKAHYLLKLGTKDQADRNNFRMVKGRLTLDNTNQSKDHKDTLELIDKEYRRALYRAKNNGGISGVRME